LRADLLRPHMAKLRLDTTFTVETYPSSRNTGSGSRETGKDDKPAQNAHEAKPVARDAETQQSAQKPPKGSPPPP
ncbi:MAG TPA: hypothetical protein VF719_12535, partial [Abditibacteriaceae bacterium]